MQTAGDTSILKVHKTAFLCSRQIAAGAVLKCYDWAIAQRYAGDCIISGFQSKLERDVLHYLLKGNQPIIVALARGLKTRIEPELKKSMDLGRLLIISPFEPKIIRVTEQTAIIRNKMMLEMADKIVVGYSSPSGNLEKLLSDYQVEYLFEQK